VAWRWNVKINEGKTQVVCSSRRFTAPQDISFVNNIRYLGVTFDRNIIRRRHDVGPVAKAISTHIRPCYLSWSESSSRDMKFTLYKSLIESIMIYASLTLEHGADNQLLKLQRLREQRFSGHWETCKVHTSPQIASGPKIPYSYDYINKLFRR
jgi:hypothetical protein